MNDTEVCLSEPPVATDNGLNRLLMIAYYFAERLSGAQRPFRFAKYLRQHGYETHIITVAGQEQPKQWDFVTQTPLPGNAGQQKDEALSRFCSGIQRLLPYNDQLQWLPYGIRAASTALKQHSYAAVLSTSPPLVTHMIAWFLKRRYGIKWVADLRDPIHGNPFRTRRGAGLYDRLIERLVISAADAVIANTDVEMEHLKSAYPRHSHKITLIWNGYDADDPIASAAKLPGYPKILIHAGSLYGGRHPRVLLESLQRLMLKGMLNAHDLLVSLVGDMDLQDAWVRECRLNSLELEGWLKCIPHTISKQEAHQQMQQADYLLLLDLNDQGISVQVPAKLFEYIRLGRPILAFTSLTSPAARILAKSGIAHICIFTDEPADEVDRKILEFLKLPTHSTSPTAWFLQQFDIAAQTAHLSTILADISVRKEPRDSSQLTKVPQRN